MSYLTARAEQALIGALLTDQPLPPEFAHLRLEDFGHRTTRELYSTITELREHTPAARLPDAVAERLAATGVHASWLRELRDKSPRPTHVAAYARMVQAAAFRRDIALEAERIAATPAGQKTPNTERLAAALTRQTQVFQAFTAIDERHATRLPAAAPEPPTSPTTGGVVTTPTDAAAERAVREDQLLADLLAHPDQATELARIVPPDTFTSEQRREVFMTIVTLAAEGDPVDEIIVAWEFQQLRALADLQGVSGIDQRPADTDPEDYDGLTYRGDETSPEPTTAYLARLAATTVVTGTAVTIGYELVVADERSRIALAAAASQHQALNHQPSPQLRPGPAVAHDPTLQPPASENPGQHPRLGR